MDFEIIDDLTGLDADALAEYEDGAVAAFNALRAENETLTDEQLAQLEALAATVTAARDLAGERETAAADRQARIDAATATIGAADESTDPEPEPEPEPDGDDGTAEVEGEGEPASTTAAAPRRNTGSLVRRAAARAPAATPPPSRSRRGAIITAQADIPGVVAASQMDDMAAIARAFSARANGFPQSSNPPEGVYLRYGVATLNRGVEAFDGHWTGNPDFEDDYTMLVDAARESSLPNGSLTASGGWCAPSETIYDLCTIESLDGIIDLPEIQVNRGGIRFTTGPDFSAIYTSAGFCQTEAQAIAGTAKPCAEVACPTFEEVRLDACGICVKAPILTNAGYPELVQRWIEGTLIAQQHKVASRLIAAMVAQLPTAVVGGTWGSAATSALTALELAGEGLRYQWRMPFNATLEAVAPHWLMLVLRNDLALRTGRDNGSVTDAEIMEHFAQRHMRVQFVYNWQDLVTTTCVVAPPATANVMLYPAGTFVKGTADVISLDTVYDTASLQANMYTAAFAEEGVLLAQVCHGGCLVTINTCMAGESGAANVTCPATP